MTIGEGQTILQKADILAPRIGMNAGSLYLQYEGLNPSGSFKDNGMATALTHARVLEAKFVACASTGNTTLRWPCLQRRQGNFAQSSSLARARLPTVNSRRHWTTEPLRYRSTAISMMRWLRVREVCSEIGIYLVNSINPFRLEGQKTIMLRVLQALNWQPPDWIVVPGGNLGNSSAFGKMFGELKHLGLIDRIPRLAIINAEGASTLDILVNERGMRWNEGNCDPSVCSQYYRELQSSGTKADTVASAIEILLPVNLAKCLRAIEITDGIVRSVSDTDILFGKALVGRYGFGCEPASGASVAGVKLLREQGIIAASDRVVCVLTGHLLKDPAVTVGYHTDPAWRAEKSIGRADLANAPLRVENDLNQIIAVIQQLTSNE